MYDVPWQVFLHFCIIYIVTNNIVSTLQFLLWTPIKNLFYILMPSTTVVHLIVIHVYTNIEENNKNYGRHIVYGMCQVPRLDVSVANDYILS